MINYPSSDFSQINHEDFYDGKFQEIAKTIINLKKDNKPIDLVTVYEEVKGKWITTKDLTSINDKSTATSAGLSSYTTTLKDYRRRREQVKIAQELIELSDGSPTALLTYADKLKELSLVGANQDDTVKFDDVNNAYEQIMERMGKKLYGYSWGRQFPFLDKATKWLLKKQIYRIGAPSWVGKTQMIYTMVPELLAQCNPDGSPLKVAFFTLENTKENTLTAIMCKAQEINQFKLTQWEVEWNWDYLVQLKDRLYIIDDVYDLDDIFNKIRQIKPDIIILDYISYVTMKGFTEEQMYTEYARKVVRFAKDNNIVWIDLSNLANDTQTNEEIMLKPKFFGSSKLVNNSDFNLMIMRNEAFTNAKNYVFNNESMFRQEDIEYFLSRDIVNMVITKNRWWPNRVRKTFWVNQDNWWNHRELEQKELDALTAKYWG